VEKNSIRKYYKEWIESTGFPVLPASRPLRENPKAPLWVHRNDIIIGARYNFFCFHLFFRVFFFYVFSSTAKTTTARSSTGCQETFISDRDMWRVIIIIVCGAHVFNNHGLLTKYYLPGNSTRTDTHTDTHTRSRAYRHRTY